LRRTRTTRSRLRYTLVCAGLLSACALQIRDNWKAPVERRHQLVGQVWDVNGNRAVPPETLLTEIARTQFVLLGEKHDNPDHHRLQARIVRDLHAAGRRPAVVFEMLSVDITPALGQALATPGVTPADLRAAVKWDKSGWPPWEMYAPIFDAALSARLPIVPGNLPPDTVATLHRGGRHALAPQQKAALGLDAPMPPERHRIMFEQIREAHCGFAPDDLVVRMVDAQRARDAQLARKLIAAGEADGAVLVAGTEHVRRDAGVPVHLAQLAPGRTAATVGFMEVSAEHATAAETLSARYGDSVPFDYVWFTPRVDDEDPCERFRKQLEQLRTTGEAAPPS
jgi:uncharacterized iron-regulated protein